MIILFRESRRVLTLKEYNESRTVLGVLSGKEYRRQRRKDKRK